MRTIICANTLPDDTDDLVLVNYKDEAGNVVVSNLSIGTHSPFDGKLMQRVDSNKTVQASFQEVQDDLVQVCACSNCNDIINVDPDTGRQILATLDSDNTELYCVSCGALNTITAADVKGDDEDEDADPQDDENEGERGKMDAGNDVSDDAGGDNEDEAGDTEQPDDDDDGDDEEDDNDDNDAQIEASLLDEDEEDPEPAITAATPVMAAVNLAKSATHLKISAYECVATAEDPIFAVRSLGRGKAMVFHVTSSGAMAPVLELNIDDAAPNNKMLFERPDLLESAFRQVCASDGFTVNIANLAGFGARDITFNVPVSNVVQNRITSGIESVTASLKDESNNMVGDLKQCLSIAAAEMIKGINANRPNPMRDEVLAAVEQLGVKDANIIVDGAFENSSEAVCASLIERTLELLSKPLDTRNEISVMVENASYRAPSGNVANRVNQALASGNLPFKGLIRTTEAVTAATRDATGDAARQPVEYAGKYKSLFDSMSKI